MVSGYKLNGQDIDTLFESFSLDEQSQYGVTDSQLTVENGRFKKAGQPLRTALNATFPTSAGNYIGGSNSTDKYKVSGQPIDVALKGRRPIGIPLAELTPGTYYLNRVNGQTWLSTSANSATGTRLSHDPQVVFIELQAGGGGGAGSGLTYAAAGGGAGGYAFTVAEIPENSYLRIEVGAKGTGGGGGSDGNNGGSTILYNASGTAIVTCTGGGGPTSKTNADGGSSGNASGGIVNINGGSGGKKEHGGDTINSFTITLPKPEQTQWSRGGYTGGTSSGNNYGGGGAASVMSAGANADSRTTPSASAGYGAGGAGAGYTAFRESSGGDGGDGIVKIYY